MGARIKSLDYALFCFKACRIRLEHERSVGRNTRCCRLVATEHRYIYIYISFYLVCTLCVMRFYETSWLQKVIDG